MNLVIWSSGYLVIWSFGRGCAYTARVRDDERLVTVAVFDTGFEAGLARGRLEGVGIRALVPEEHLFRSGGPAYASPAHLQVLESDRDRAIAELRRLQIRLVHPAPREEE
jgi:hypothetical protein